MTDITPIIEAVIALLAAVVSVYLIPWLRSHTTAKQRAELVAWAKIAVAAAEQLFKGAGRGKEKKAYVVEFLVSKGVGFDIDAIDNAIEAAVKQLNTEGLTVD